MPSSSVSVPRQLIHTRKINAEIFLRQDGLWDIEASLLDTKGKDFPLSSGVRLKGEPIHNMTLYVTIDKELNVLQAKVKAKSVPYLGHCEKIEPDYEKLVGLNLGRGFRSAIKELFSGVSGCSHMTELCSVLPTAAIQGFAGEVITVKERADGQMPFQLNGCHALRTDGEAVKKYHPIWFGAPIKSKENSK